MSRRSALIQRALPRLDAAESVFIQRELQAIEAQFYETPFGPFNSEKLLPFAFDAPAGAREWGYDRIAPHGIAQWIAANAKDLPRANVSRKRVTFPIKSMGLAYGFTREDILAAMMANIPLEQEEARACRRGIDSFRDKVLLTGDSSVGFVGFINEPLVPKTNPVNGGWMSLPIDTAGDLMIQDMSTASYSVYETTKRAFPPNTLAMPMAQYGRVTTTRLPNSGMTAAEFFLKNNPFIKELVPVEQLKAAGDAGTDRMIAYFKDPAVVVAKIAMLFEQLPPQEQGMEIVVPTWSRIGGCHWRAPIAGLYVDGI